MVSISKNRKNILLDITEAHKKSVYSSSPIPKLVAVSKQQDDIKVEEAIKHGQKIFGENRVQEAYQRWHTRLEKYNDIELRLIGPLQTNKVKDSLNLFHVIETVDREKLANVIAKNRHFKDKTKAFYIQINTGNEIQKSGVEPLQSDEFINYCIRDLRLPIKGLMCIPPQYEDASMHFVLLKKIADRNNLVELSMGMSSDYKKAIKFGATSVRIGSLFFGNREK